MEKDNIKENEIKSEVEETEVETSNIETTEVDTNTKDQEIKEESVNIETTELLNDEEVKGNSFMQVISASVLDQVVLVAVSAVLVLLFSVLLKLLGYMFVEGTGAIVITAAIIYLILNCIYAPIMEKTKMKNTIAKKILNIN